MLEAPPGADLDATMSALGDRTRRRILQRLAQGPATAGQLADLFEVSRPATSRHVRVLRDAHLVRATTRGRHVWWEADAEPLRRAAEWLDATAKRVADAPRLHTEDR